VHATDKAADKTADTTKDVAKDTGDVAKKTGTRHQEGCEARWS